MLWELWGTRCVASRPVPSPMKQHKMGKEPEKDTTRRPVREEKTGLLADVTARAKTGKAKEGAKASSLLQT